MTDLLQPEWCCKSQLLPYNLCVQGNGTGKGKGGEGRQGAGPGGGGGGGHPLQPWCEMVVHRSGCCPKLCVPALIRSLLWPPDPCFGEQHILPENRVIAFLPAFGLGKGITSATKVVLLANSILLCPIRADSQLHLVKSCIATLRAEQPCDLRDHHLTVRGYVQKARQLLNHPFIVMLEV